MEGGPADSGGDGAPARHHVVSVAVLVAAAGAVHKEVAEPRPRRVALRG
jgi:hypothetical protein